MKIHFLNGLNKGSSRTLPPQGVSIGRESDNDISLLTEGVSRYHIKIELRGDSWIVRDMGSTNGTEVNGKSIPMSQVLQEGDLISVGDQNIRIGDEKLVSVMNDVKPPPSINASTTSQLNAPLQTPKLDNVFEQKPLNQEVQNIEQDNVSLKDMNIFENENGNSKNTTKNKSNFIKLLFNVSFYFIIILIAVGAILLFLNDSEQKETTRKKSSVVKIEKEHPLVLCYEKKKISKDNIFRYYLQLEENSARLVLDEIKEGRTFSANIANIDKTIISQLKKQIENSEFMDISQRHSSIINDGSESIISISVVLNNKVKEITIRNEAPKGAFEKVENLVKDFSLNTLGIPFAISSEETKQIGMDAFYKAEELFRNYEAKPLNLYLAIRNYKRAENMLGQFPYEKEELVKARLQNKKATQLSIKIIKKYKLAISQAFQEKNYAKARRYLAKIMNMVKPYGVFYMDAKKKILIIDRASNNKEKK